MVVPKRRIGIYGGTFDPIHMGHLILAETAADSLNLQRVLFVPAADPPHKDPDIVRVSAEHRLAMVERAIGDNPRFALSRVDMDRPGPHYSVDTIRLIQEEMPDAEFYFLIGADSLRALPTWTNAEGLSDLVILGVMHRPDCAPDMAEIEHYFPGIRRRVLWIDAPINNLSSTRLAKKIATGRSTRYQIHDQVREYIEEQGLYRDRLYV